LLLALLPLAALLVALLLLALLLSVVLVLVLVLVGAAVLLAGGGVPVGAGADAGVLTGAAAEADVVGAGADVVGATTLDTTVVTGAAAVVIGVEVPAGAVRTGLLPTTDERLLSAALAEPGRISPISRKIAAIATLVVRFSLRVCARTKRNASRKRAKSCAIFRIQPVARRMYEGDGRWEHALKWPRAPAPRAQNPCCVTRSARSASSMTPSPKVLR
jgi:hypothetical protein